jgi:hypothetical protein
VRPDPACGPELCNLFEEVDVGIEEKTQAWGEAVDVQPSRQAEFDVTEAIREGEGEFLSSGRSRFSDVIARDAQRLVCRDLLAAVLHHVPDQAKVRDRWEEPLFLSDVLLEDVGLQGAIERRDVDALPLRRHQIHAEDRHGRA